MLQCSHQQLKELKMSDMKKTSMKGDGTLEADVAISAAIAALDVARRKLAEAAHNGNATKDAEAMYKKIGEIQSMLVFL